MAGGSVGMSLRDFFAGEALSGVVAGHMALASLAAGNGIEVNNIIDSKIFASCVYEIADAMLAERAKVK